MSPRGAARLAWSLWGVALALLLGVGIGGFIGGGEFDLVFVSFVIFIHPEHASLWLSDAGSVASGR